MKREVSTRETVGQALAKIPQGVFVMTSHFEDRVAGVMVSWVQQVAFEPPMVMVAIRKGRPITPLILDSHTFALCQVAKDDRLTMRKFFNSESGDEFPFQSLELHRAATGAPIIAKSLAYLDCEVVRHVDVEADHDIYIGHIVAGEVLHDGEVILRDRESGYEY